LPITSAMATTMLWSSTAEEVVEVAADLEAGFIYGGNIESADTGCLAGNHPSLYRCGQVHLADDFGAFQRLGDNLALVMGDSALVATSRAMRMA